MGVQTSVCVEANVAGSSPRFGRPQGLADPLVDPSGLALLVVLGAGPCLSSVGCSPHTYSLVPVLIDTKKNKGKSLPV